MNNSKRPRTPSTSTPATHVPGTVVGQHVDVLSVATSANRRELIATCRRDGRTYRVALLDIDLNANPATSRPLAAYRR
jgi:hypothetical protein